MPRHTLGFGLAAMVFLMGAEAQPSEQDIAAARAMGVLLSLEEGPHIMTSICKQVDPDGDAPRQKLYEDWKKDNRDLLAKIDQYASSMIPTLYPIISPDAPGDPVKAFRARQFNLDSREISGLDPARKHEACESFPHAAFFDHDRTSAVTSQAFQVLDAWKKEHDAGSTTRRDVRDRGAA